MFTQSTCWRYPGTGVSVSKQTTCSADASRTLFQRRLLDTPAQQLSRCGKTQSEAEWRLGRRSLGAYWSGLVMPLTECVPTRYERPSDVVIVKQDNQRSHISTEDISSRTTYPAIDTLLNARPERKHVALFPDEAPLSKTSVPEWPR